MEKSINLNVTVFVDGKGNAGFYFLNLKTNQEEEVLTYTTLAHEKAIEIGNVLLKRMNELAEEMENAMPKNIGKESTYKIAPDDQMVAVCVYCDTTGLYTEEEYEIENLTELDFPLSLLREYYESNRKEFVEEIVDELGIPDETATFDLWRKEVYTADSTINFYDFCAERGFYAQRED